MSEAVIHNSLLIETEIVYPYPELELVGDEVRAAGGIYVYIYTQYDTAGDSAAIVDFSIKIDGTPATLSAWSDGMDSTIRITILETITAGQTVTITYVPNVARWIIGNSHVLYAMTDKVVLNDN